MNSRSALKSDPAAPPFLKAVDNLVEFSALLSPVTILIISCHSQRRSTSSTWEHCATRATTAPRVPQGAPEFLGEGDIATRVSVL
ncbi:hypothetical protein PILCRDRAFT_17561 [Piloderma croceum F 1598]|uniref:Uncharacterized protein n=1 Tax=Piloderma croceum (strain F 1598) TaxID=765440 RepID=A0A0C3ES64_PILCF|nr:hypothetical protein PILCRDRAFT_17561 [Piloderma croceum F 1598]